MLSPARLESCFKGLADANRLRILNLLFYGELCGCDIQYVLDLTQSNVSRHLNYLKHAGLVTARREGFRVFYRQVEWPRTELAPLFEFLQTAFRNDPSYRQDLHRLKQALAEGACRMVPLRRLPPVSRRLRRIHSGTGRPLLNP